VSPLTSLMFLSWGVCVFGTSRIFGSSRGGIPAGRGIGVSLHPLCDRRFSASCWEWRNFSGLIGTVAHSSQGKPILRSMDSSSSRGGQLRALQGPLDETSISLSAPFLERRL